MISLTFRRSIDDEKKIITLFLSSLTCLLAGCFSHLHIWIFYHHLVGSLRIYSRTMGKVEKSNQKKKTQLRLVSCSHHQPSACMDLMRAKCVHTQHAPQATAHRCSAVNSMARTDGCEFRNCSRKTNPHTHRRPKKKNVIYRDSGYLRMANEPPPPSVGTNASTVGFPFAFPFAPWTEIESEWCLFIAQFSVHTLFFSRFFFSLLI